MKLSTFILTLFITGVGFTQQTKVDRAISEFDSKNYSTAKKYIDAASEHKTTLNKASTWKAKGDIYTALLMKKQADVISAQNALSYYKKALALDTVNKYKRDIDVRCQNTGNQLLNKGVVKFNEELYEISFNTFVCAKNMSEFAGITDSLAIFNAALASERAEKSKRAIDWYQRCIDINYRAKDCYTFIVHLYRMDGDNKMAKETLSKARIAFPNDQNLLINEINYALAEGRYEELVESLQKAISQDPTNEILHFSLGTVQQNLGNLEEAIKHYEKAVELNPNYFDGWYNLAALHFNVGVEQNNAANEEEKVSGYEALKEASVNSFSKSLPAFEQAYRINSKSIGLLTSMKAVYMRLDNTEMYLKMKKEISEL